MRIAIASGKGGAGKTSVTASLAHVWDRVASGPLTCVDMDVEEPNLHLFLHPAPTAARPVTLRVPLLDREACTACGACAELCQFAAIARVGKAIVITESMCHGCGGCFAVCPANALRDGERELGTVEQGPFALPGGSAGTYVAGRLRVGEAMSPPLMRAVHGEVETLCPDGDILIDAPPGVSCPAIAAVSGADCILLVADPTPFGFHDFALAHEAFAPLGIPMAVFVNRDDIADGDAGGTGGIQGEDIDGYCAAHGLPIVGRLPFSREVGMAYARGVVPAALEAVAPRFVQASTALRAMHREVRHACAH